MVKEVLGKILRSKLVIFSVQFVLLSLFIYTSNYSFQINFDPTITPERQVIIQFLGNYIFYKDISTLLFLAGIWIGISLIPILVFKDPRTATSANIKILFFLNFFFFVFLYRYSSSYFNKELWNLFLKAFILAGIVIIFSVVLSYGIKKLIQPKEETHIENLKKITKLTTSTCPNCGAKFQSNPKYCYKCLTELSKSKENPLVNNSD